MVVYDSHKSGLTAVGCGHIVNAPVITPLDYDAAAMWTNNLINAPCVEEVAPAGHKLRLTKKPQDYECNEASQDTGLVKVKWPQLFVLLSNDSAHISSAFQILLFGQAQVKHLQPQPAQNEIDDHWKHGILHPTGKVDWILQAIIVQSTLQNQIRACIDRVHSIVG